MAISTQDSELKTQGLLTPFRRDKKSDWASGSGADLLESKVIQSLMTEGATPRSSGELPWRTSFGSGLHLLRHQRNDDVLAELGRVYVRDAFKRWVPEAELVSVAAKREQSTLSLHIRFKGAIGSGSAEKRSTEISLLLED